MPFRLARLQPNAGRAIIQELNSSPLKGLLHCPHVLRRAAGGTAALCFHVADCADADTRKLGKLNLLNASHGAGGFQLVARHKHSGLLLKSEARTPENPEEWPASKSRRQLTPSTTLEKLNAEHCSGKRSRFA
jgi:hypothetical protein